MGCSFSTFHLVSAYPTTTIFILKHPHILLQVSLIMSSLTPLVRNHFSFLAFLWIFSHIYSQTVIKLYYNSPAQTHSSVNICQAPALAQGEVIGADLEGLFRTARDRTRLTGASAGHCRAETVVLGDAALRSMIPRDRKHCGK